MPTITSFIIARNLGAFLIYTLLAAAIPVAWDTSAWEMADSICGLDRARLDCRPFIMNACWNNASDVLWWPGNSVEARLSIAMIVSATFLCRPPKRLDR